MTKVSEENLSGIVYRLVEFAPKEERQRTGAGLVQILRTTNNSSLVSAICFALRTLSYRAAIPQLLAVLEEFPIGLAGDISELLVEWRVIEAAPVIRSVLEMNRFGTSFYIRDFARRLYQLGGAAAARFLAEVVADAVPDQQCLLLGSLKDMNESVFLEVVSNLAANSPEMKVRTKATEFLGTKRSS